MRTSAGTDQAVSTERLSPNVGCPWAYIWAQDSGVSSALMSSARYIEIGRSCLSTSPFLVDHSSDQCLVPQDILVSSNPDTVTDSEAGDYYGNEGYAPLVRNPCVGAAIRKP
ncbi:hypothetical protein MRX96_038796 [Rhipicephalus microplus]